LLIHAGKPFTSLGAPTVGRQRPGSRGTCRSTGPRRTDVGAVGTRCLAQQVTFVTTPNHAAGDVEDRRAIHLRAGRRGPARSPPRAAALPGPPTMSP